MKKKSRRLSCVDPTADIQEELEESLTAATRLSERLAQTGINRQEQHWLENELKKTIRAIYWTCDDYQHTLSVLSVDSSRTLLSEQDRRVRLSFIESARGFADDIREQVLGLAAPPRDTVKVHRSITAMATGSGSYKYSLLNDDDDVTEVGGGSSNSNGGGGGRFEDILMKQQEIIRDQDDDLELVGKSVGTLKHMSYRIGDELDQQASMLDDLGQDMERVDTRLDGVMKKMAKLAHLDDDKRQCKVIMILSALLFFLVFLLIVL